MGYATPREREAALRRVIALDRLLDWRFSLLGIKFGLDPLLGLIPVVGGVVTGVLALYTVVVAWRVGVPGGTILLMLLNIFFDLLVGEVPVAGDLFDVFYKANRINLRLLGRHVVLPPIPV